ncbi:MAG: hypothetical protein ACE362_27775 [Phaeodactylibacter xiamenensis]|uniref:Effector-associated domain-containing protein n=1 Tax=Phaeodactylibacter xiamenensis TaxID=1524460 RepID=A0A098S1D4_9BACT|nr:hypothetical protein [Phaeodactylibacter xiamenensis]KGE85866.1 hypothetical protein IX84_24960 [Phaeodactylibacter xiamenensis]MCR9053129.1 hypothetical protein [bacterium]
MSNSYKDRLESMPSRWLLTAGRNEPISADGRPGQHSHFAQAVLAVLKNNQDKRLRVSEFCNRVLYAVGQNAKDQLPRGAALYDVGDMGGEFMFRLKDFAYEPVEEKRGTAPDGATSSRGSSFDTRRGSDDKPAPKKAKPTTLKGLKKQLKGFLAAGEFERVFDTLNDLISDDSYRGTDIIMQQARYNRTKREQNQGTIRSESAQLTFNQIQYAMIDLVDSLEEEDLILGKVQEEQPVNSGSDGQVNSLSDLERQGLEYQAALLQRKLNSFNEALIKVFDPSMKFNLEEQIKETRHQLEEVRRKLGEARSTTESSERLQSTGVDNIDTLTSKDQLDMLERQLVYFEKSLSERAGEVQLARLETLVKRTRERISMIQSRIKA